MCRYFAYQGRQVHRLAVSHAFHSLLMEPMPAKFARIAAGISVSKRGFGGVQCDRADGRRRLRRWTVLGGACAAPRAIAEGVQLLNAVGATRFVEVGPGGGLTAWSSSRCL